MKRAITAAAIVVASIVGLGAWAVNAEASGSGNETFTLEGHQTTIHIVDEPPTGLSSGDFGVFAGDLSRGGRPAGKYQGYCMQIDSKNHSECQYSYALPDGQLMIAAGYGPGVNGNLVTHEAIIGGTGLYAQARGFAVGRETGRDTIEEVIHLED